MTNLLSVRGVHTYYGRVQALKGVDIDVNDGEIVTLIGANGAGKSTLMMTICGNPRAREGTIHFAGRDITHLPTHEIAHLKLAQAPEGRRIFSRMTVLENLQMGATTAAQSTFAADLERVLALFPRLKERLSQRGGTLSGGEQQMLAVARALMLRPRLMLLDEPSFGLAPLVVRDLFGILGKINREDKVSILVVEQNAQLALELADQAYVIETGRIVMSGNAKDIANNEEIRKSYLGY
jgi:branched-chain amino acid transport system ATP-binding protein